MKQQNLTELSIEDLKQKKTILKTINIVFIGVLSFLVGVIIYIIIINGITPLIAVPIVLLPILFVNFKNLNEIDTEIKSREK